MLICCKRKVLLAGWVVGGWADWVCVRRRCVRRARGARDARAIRSSDGKQRNQRGGQRSLFPCPQTVQ